LTPELGESFRVTGLQGGVDVERLADDAGAPVAVLDRLEAAQDQLGVGLADAEGSHGAQRLKK
jgi:hypothetical protein